MSTATPLDAANGASTRLPQETIDFYRDAMAMLRRAGIPFLVGGAYALHVYTGIVRHTKDFDIFLLPEDVNRALGALTKAGYTPKIQVAHWLAKVFRGDAFVDLIYNSGNGAVRMDEGWFEHAPEAEVFGVRVKLVPPEEMIWCKSFIMERERYDGADIAHMLLQYAERLDWRRLLSRFGPHWRLLLNELVLFGFIYPGQRDRVPRWVMDQLLGRLHEELATPPPAERVCNGTLLSRQQYLTDVAEWDFADSRIVHGYMTAEQIEEFTDGIREDGQPADPRDLAQMQRELHEKLHEHEQTPL